MKSFISTYRAATTVLLLAGIAGLATSCKDYLDVEPLTLTTTAATFSTVSGATSAVLGAYDPLSGDNTYGTRLSMYFPYDTDEMISSSGTFDTGRRGIARYKAFANNTEVINPWNNLYQGVERANICIENIPQMELYTKGTSADTAALHRLYGEALTLRAQYYYELIRNWGDVPAQFTPSKSGQDFNLPNADRNVTLTKLIDDLYQAEKLVPYRSAAGLVNERITKGAVKALRARLALQRGGYSLHGTTMTRASDYLDYYKIARQECLDLMSKRTEHTLNPSFSDLWRGVNEQRHDVANEILFEVGMTGSTATGDSKLGYYNGPRLNASTIYGSTQGAVTVVPTYFYAFDSTDVRRDITVAPYQIPSNNNQAGVALNTIYDGKFRRDWHIPPLPGTNNYLGYNWPIIRFADVLLMYAEADNELNGPTTAAVAALKEVRTRGFGGNATRAAVGLNTSTKADLFNAIVNERLLEFGSEGIRKYDLLRWNLLGQKLADTKASLNLMRTGAAPYQNVPLYQYYKVVNGMVQWTRSFYKPSPTNTTAPSGTTRVNWRQSIDATYVANLQPNGTSVTLGTTTVTSIGSGLAAEFVAGQGRELLPIPQTTLDTDPALKQNSGY
ncbi:RagB/SusD family nutrient uptake outer membrane protein [Hymenobacter sp. BT770]|uniref:RagB/SusD family nutrient uptake outer membrane protein n=1 Tax=Hymenobacter sp. BT770 TaxID=2886942 RepID=UPI001D10EF74|nr:RagB/SusD family nutrient uptake outer membrane protein [Hymenobacter sp. BT770]MCC3154819.1 RagB/SusD family nutrient uptake outer membrane protein [Hymenobacter sp. BT770]MDO3416806.1 RagB/SusD family nutrient uptake outer membrane protein [Hymenobacter sp. BT770]